MKFFKKEPEKTILFVCVENAGRRSDVEDILMVTVFTANKIIEAYEAPASLYCVFTRKVSK